MALTANITKVSVTEVGTNVWDIIMKLKLFEDAIETHNENFTFQFQLGDDVNVKKLEVLTAMQDAIDTYKSEELGFGAAKVAALINYLDNNLVL